MSLTLNKESGSTTFTKVSEGENQVEHRDLSRSLSLPLSLRQTAKIGRAGSLGNDRIRISVQDTIANSVTGKIVTGSVSIEVSIPRDVEFDAQHTKDMVCYARSFLTLTDQEDAIAAGSLNRS